MQAKVPFGIRLVRRVLKTHSNLGIRGCRPCEPTRLPHMEGIQNTSMPGVGMAGPLSNAMASTETYLER
jgi:hypothetical protein